MGELKGRKEGEVKEGEKGKEEGEEGVKGGQRGKG